MSAKTGRGKWEEGGRAGLCLCSVSPTVLRETPGHLSLGKRALLPVPSEASRRPALAPESRLRRSQEDEKSLQVGARHWMPAPLVAPKGEDGTVRGATGAQEVPLQRSVLGATCRKLCPTLQPLQQLWLLNQRQNLSHLSTCCHGHSASRVPSPSSG